MENKKEAVELDLVFVCDCTGSMSSYIQSAKENITSIIETIQASEQRDVQFALISYKDHPPQDTTYVTKVFEFTPSVRKAKEYVQTMDASGGGDTPEAVSAALHDALNLPYRKNATKIVVFVADAPCHGLTSQIDDGFPDGSPDGADPIKDSRTMAERGIILYAVGCEPVLGNAPFARDFFKAISQVTGGRYISLGNAKALPKVIIGGAEEEIHLNKLEEEIEKEAALVQSEADENKESLDEDALYSRVTERLQSKGIETAQLKVDDIGDSEETTEISRKISECDDLKAVKAMLDKDFATHPGRVSQSLSSYSYGGPMLECCDDDMDDCCLAEEEECEDDDDDCDSAPAPRARVARAPMRSAAPAPSSFSSYECQEARVESAKISKSQVSRMMTKKKYVNK